MTKISRLLYVLCIIIAFSQNSFSQNFKIEDLTIEDYLADLSTLNELLQKQHPNPYRFISREDDEERRRIATLKLKANPSFENFLKCFNKFGDGHLAYTPSEEEFLVHVKKEFSFFPIPVTIKNGKMFVNIKGGTLPYTTEILSIQKYSVKELLKTFNTYFHGDGYIMSRTEALASEFFPLYYSILINNKIDSFKIKYIDNNTNKTKTLTVKAIDYYELYRKEKLAIQPVNKVELDGLVDSHYYRDKKTGVLTINSFDLDEAYAYKKFSLFFKKIKKDKYENVIIDIRNNGGGDPNMAALLFSFLMDENFKNEFNYRVKTIKVEKENLLDDSGSYANDDLINNYENFLYQRFNKDENGYIGNDRLKEGLLENFPADKDNYKGNVFLMVGGNTFSAAVYFAKLFKDHKRGEIIGMETGGNENTTFAGYFLNYKLPKTRVQVRIPITELFFGTQKKSLHGVLPSVTVPMKKYIQYLKEEKDPDLEYLFENYTKQY